MSTQQKVLIIGGSGFLGSHTANALSRAGYAVRIFDHAESRYLQPGQEMVVGDITDSNALSAATNGCEYVYHFAGIADIEEANENPIETCRSNILGTCYALEASVKNQVKRFVFASTVYVYSDSGGFYRVSKQACEGFIESYQKRYGLPYTILRYGSLYGRRAGPTNGIYRLIRAAIETGEITYKGSREAVREYIHVADAARLSAEILDKQYENRHFVLTGQERLRVADIMRMIAEMLPNKPRLNFNEENRDSAHYIMTPYAYSPKIGHKLTSNDHIDLGQGLLDCIADMHREIEDGR